MGHTALQPDQRITAQLVEVLFGIMTRQAIRRGSFDKVKELVAAISKFIDGWNDRCHPVTWTKTADEILPRPPVNEIPTGDTSAASRPGRGPCSTSGGSRLSSGSWRCARAHCREG
jgi:hypothetical protein